MGEGGGGRFTAREGGMGNEGSPLHYVCVCVCVCIVSNFNIMKTLILSLFQCMLGYFGVSIIHGTLTWI